MKMKSKNIAINLKILPNVSSYFFTTKKKIVISEISKNQFTKDFFKKF